MVNAQCGGLKINTDNLKVLNGVVTDVNATAVTNTFNAKECGGQLFDADYFEEVDGAITLKGVTAVTNTLRANCSLTFDADNFEVDDGALGYNSDLLHEITFTLTPTDATVVLTDENDMVINPDDEGKYHVLIGKTYDYVVSKTGYVTVTDDVTIETTTSTIVVTLEAEAGE